MPPKLLAKPDRASGVLPVNAAARAASSTQSNKQPAARLKLEIRRLPPGLTITEFEETLGEEWKLGKGKVDWREYRSGKIRSMGKLPEQSRCYVHLVSEALVKDFEQRFLAVVFHDKAGTYKNPELRHLPPTLGYAPNQRVPILGKQRVDNRQGMIDQDPEFIAFLEAETQPIPKALALDAPGTAKDESKVEVRSTPLIDDLRERKANKAKAAASKAERKAGKSDHTESSPAIPAKDGGKNAGKGDAKKSEQSSKTTAKAASKQTTAKAAATAKQPASTPSQQKDTATTSAKKKKEKSQTIAPKQTTAKPATSAASSTNTQSTTNSSGPASQRALPAQRARRDAEGIKKMLQKDLGIRPKTDKPATTSARSRGVSQAADPPQPSKSEPQASAKSSQPSSSPATNNASTSNAASSPSTSTPKAFLKHANPSQGMTEALIQQALSQYGEITSVTIDPRKGTAIAVFKSQDVLQKAMAARKVSVANGAVEVLEYRDRSGNAGAASSKGGGRGSGRAGRGRGGGAAAAAAANNASMSAGPNSTPAAAASTAASAAT